MKTATKSRASATVFAAPAPQLDGEPCCHHWLLGQPDAGHVPAVCRKCGVSRDYPAVLDDLDPPGEPDKGASSESSEPGRKDRATAAGGARPSPVGP